MDLVARPPGDQVLKLASEERLVYFHSELLTSLHTLLDEGIESGGIGSYRPRDLYPCDPSSHPVTEPREDSAGAAHFHGRAGHLVRTRTPPQLRGCDPAVIALGAEHERTSPRARCSSRHSSLRLVLRQPAYIDVPDLHPGVDPPGVQTEVQDGQVCNESGQGTEADRPLGAVGQLHDRPVDDWLMPPTIGTGGKDPSPAR